MPAEKETIYTREDVIVVFIVGCGVGLCTFAAALALYAQAAVNL